MNEDVGYTHSEIDPFWSFHETLTVNEATAIICGHEPTEVIARLSDSYFSAAYPRFRVVQSLLEKTLRKGDIEGTNIPLTEVVWNDEHEIAGTTNPKTSVVDRDSLIRWLRSKGFKTGFFFPDANPDTPGYLDPNHKRYAPRLAAAVSAWVAMEDQNLLDGDKPKAAMEKWLSSRYKEFRLTQKQANEKAGYRAGDISKSAVSAAAEIANWDTNGGATPTPGA